MLYACSRVCPLARRMEKHKLLRQLPLFRPLIKRLQRVESEERKLRSKVATLKQRLAEKDAELATVYAALRRFEQPNDAATTEQPAANSPAVDPTLAQAEAEFNRMEYPRSEKFPADGEPPWLDRPDAISSIQEKLKHGQVTAFEAEQLQKWVANGYLIIERAIDGPLLDKVWASYEEAIANGTVELQPEKAGTDDPWPGRFQDPHLKVPALCQLLRHPVILHWIRLLLGKEPAPFQTITSHKGSQQREHSDTIHMTTYPLGYLAASWIAFEDIHPDSGPLVYYPGSQRFDYVFSKDVGIPEEEYRERGFGAYFERYEPRIQSVIAEKKATPHYFLANKGDVLIWHANLLHGGSARRDLRHSRRALVNHYFAEGVICYHDFGASKPKPFHGTCLVEAAKSQH